MHTLVLLIQDLLQQDVPLGAQLWHEGRTDAWWIPEEVDEEGPKI